MRYLLDTCILLWFLQNDRQKLGNLLETIIDEHHFVAVSVASYWEITIKQSLGKIVIDGDVVNAAHQSGFVWIAVETRHIDQLKRLPAIHKDPFDRILIAQSIADGLKMVTYDKTILQYF